MEEFKCSLRQAFAQVVDVNHLMKEISPQRKVTNIPTTTSYLKNRFFAPVDLEIPFPGMVTEGKIHGHKAVKICDLFVKLSVILKPGPMQSEEKNLASIIEAHANIFSLYSPGPQTDEDVRIWSNNTRKVSQQDLVFMWGFKHSMSAGTLKSLLQKSHKVFSKEFDVRFVDKSCAIVVFWEPGLSKTFLDVLNGNSEIVGDLRELVSEGVRVASYNSYDRACRLGCWDENVADSLDKALEDPDGHLDSDCVNYSSKTQWCNEWMINLDEL